MDSALAVIHNQTSKQHWYLLVWLVALNDCAYGDIGRYRSKNANKMFGNSCHTLKFYSYLKKMVIEVLLFLNIWSNDFKLSAQ